jgi:hypothetical protein
MHIDQEELNKAPNVKNTEALQRQLVKDQEKNAHKRAFDRHKIFAVATMILSFNSQEVEGVITEVSQGGLKFRPATSFLLERNGERVSIIVDDIKKSAIIRASRADGYGVQLLDEIDVNEINYILRNYKAQN